MDGWNLLDKCCWECFHSAETPCSQWVKCRLEGPLCHNTDECKKLRKKRLKEIRYGKEGFRINVGLSSCGLASGAKETFEAFKEAIEKEGIQADLIAVGCMGLCYLEPLVELISEKYPSAIYARVTPDKAVEILNEYVSGDVSSAFALRERKGTAIGEEKIPLLSELDVWRYQVKWVSRNCGIVNPESIEEYIAVGGYLGLERALSMRPEEVIEEIKLSELRGRGGAGFPTWLKWDICRKQREDEKYIICNADEGDPGAFMNRMLAEADPHRVLEGLIIGGYAIGASKAFIFVRAEKPLMADRLEKAVKEAESYGLLGDNILGSGYSLEVEVVRSAGAFVCGEETAMIAAIEGRRAMPRQRPPYPATSGLWGKPTIVNNVETLAHVATIMAEGWREFTRYGTEKSKGTKIFCVTGDVRRTGAFEVPLGITIRKLVFDIAGGPPQGVKIKAVQIGGPSGGCLPEDLLNLPIDYESLRSAGAIMGSGGLVVIGDDKCIVDVARYFTSFTLAESCGKCIPCRVGTKALYDTLTSITEGMGREEDLDLLFDVGKTMVDASLCALGGTAPNPVLSTLRYFRDEYMAHVKEKRCPAKVCTKLVSYVVDESKCTGCGICAKACPENAITVRDKARIDPKACVRCGACYIACPLNAIIKR